MPKSNEEYQAHLIELGKAIDAEPGKRERLERILREAKERGRQQPGSIRVTVPSKKVKP